MTESIRLVLTHFTDEAVFVTMSIMLVLLVIITALWIYNRKRFHELKHQIPASVVKDYLDTVIQNSNALKSALFRGGGLDVTDGIPSVMPVSGLAHGNVNIDAALQADLNQKLAEISSLRTKLQDKDRQIRDLEDRMSTPSSGDGGEDVKIYQQEIEKLRAKIKELEARPAAAASSGGDNPETLKKLQDVSKERDDLKDRLREYEILEDDLANLKRFQQENEELKKSLAALKGAGAAVATAAVAAVAPTPAPEPAPAPVAATIDMSAPIEDDDFEAQMAAAIGGPAPAPATAAADIPALEGEQKSAQDLLAEFENMLGDS